MIDTPDSSRMQRSSRWLLAPAAMLLVAAACTTDPAPQTGTASGKETTCTLAVENMTCATCPLQVRKAISRVDGVAKAEATLEPPQARVTFDADKTSAAVIAAAAADIGYPAKVLSCAESTS